VSVGGRTLTITLRFSIFERRCSAPRPQAADASCDTRTPHAKKEHQLRRTRLAVAAGVAAFTLGATAAVAVDSEPQTVTITVEAAARTITQPENVSLTAKVGDNISDEGTPKTDTATLSYTNPEGRGTAKIAIEVTGSADLGADAGAGQLFLGVDSSTPSSGTSSGAKSIGVNITAPLITDIFTTAAGSATLTFTFSSANNAALTETLSSITRNVIYFITDQ
jgi:hypothetical protein